jgi:hypothetical protein
MTEIKPTKQQPESASADRIHGTPLSGLALKSSLCQAGVAAAALPDAKCRDPGYEAPYPKSGKGP